MKKTATKFLENMRTSSEVEKRAFSFWVSFFVTGFIFLIWVVGFFSTLSSTPGDVKNEASPFQAIYSSVKSVIDQSNQSE